MTSIQSVMVSLPTKQHGELYQALANYVYHDMAPAFILESVIFGMASLPGIFVVYYAIKRYSFRNWGMMVAYSFPVALACAAFAAHWALSLRAIYEMPILLFIFPNFWVEAIFFGALSTLVIILYISFCLGADRRHSISSIVLLATVTGMYASALMHFVVGIYSWIGEGLSGYQLLTSSSPTGRIILATLTINSIFSDAVALWRACVVWMNRPIIVIVSAVLLLAGMVSGIANLVLVATSSPEVLIFGPYYDWPGLVFLSSSLLSNAFSTAVIGFKAWSHRRRLRGHLLSSRRTMAEKILILFVESGAVFICIWAAYIALVVRFNTLGGVIIGNQLVPLYAFHSALIQIITIYPTSIILLVVLEKRQIMRGGSTISKSSSAQLDYKLPPIVTINTMVHTEPEGVIVIGHHALTVESSRDDLAGGHRTSQGESDVEKRSEGDGTP